MCSNTRQHTTASNVAEANGRASAPERTYSGPLPRRCASTIWLTVGSTPTTVAPWAALTARATWPSPVPTSSTRRCPAVHSTTMGRICSVYSGSTPSVNSRCHQSAWASQSSELVSPVGFGISSSAVAGHRPEGRTAASQLTPPDRDPPASGRAPGHEAEAAGVPLGQALTERGLGLGTLRRVAHPPVGTMGAVHDGADAAGEAELRREIAHHRHGSHARPAV